MQVGTRCFLSSGPLSTVAPLAHICFFPGGALSRSGFRELTGNP